MLRKGGWNFTSSFASFKNFLGEGSRVLHLSSSLFSLSTGLIGFSSKVKVSEESWLGFWSTACAKGLGVPGMELNKGKEADGAGLSSDFCWAVVYLELLQMQLQFCVVQLG